MVERSDPVNAGEQITNAPSSIPIKTDDQFRMINQRLEALADEVSKLSRPPQFRVADVATLVAVMIGLGIAIFSAFGLNERVSDLRTDIGLMESRLTSRSAETEARLGGKLDKLSDQFNALAERLARVEGDQQVKPDQ